MIKQGYEQYQGQGHGKRWVRPSQQTSANLDRYCCRCRDQPQQEFANAFADEPDHRDQVVKIIEQLDDSFHCEQSAHDRQHRAAAIRATRLIVVIVESSIVRFFRVSDRPMKKLPALPCGLILEEYDRRISFLALV